MNDVPIIPSLWQTFGNCSDGRPLAVLWLLWWCEQSSVDC